MVNGTVYFQILLPTFQFIRPQISGDIDNDCSTSMSQYSFKREGGLNTAMKAVTANSKHALSSLLEAPPGEQADIPSVIGYPLVSRWFRYFRYLERFIFPCYKLSCLHKLHQFFNWQITDVISVSLPLPCTWYFHYVKTISLHKGILYNFIILQLTNYQSMEQSPSWEANSLQVNQVAQLVEALRYKLEGRGFVSRWCHWNFSLT